MPPVSSPTSPPPKTRQPRTPAPPRVNPEKVLNDRTEAVAGVFQIIGAVCAMTGQLADSAAVNMHGPAIARETADLASRYERVGTVIDGLAQVGPFTAILAATMPLVIQIAANHKRISPEKATAMGAESPEMLEGKMRMEQRRQQYAYEQRMRQEEELLKQMYADMERETVAA